MKNKDRIMSDLAFLVGSWERKEITAEDAVLTAQRLTRECCDNCIAKTLNTCHKMTCAEGFLAYLREEAT